MASALEEVSSLLYTLLHVVLSGKGATVQVEIDVSLMLRRKENCSPFRLDVADIAVLLQCRAVLTLEPHAPRRL